MENSSGQVPPVTRYQRILPRAPNANPSDLMVFVPHSERQLTARLATAKPRRPPTTSSERGKAFRARRKIYRGELQVQLVELEEEIRRLQEHKSLLQVRLLQRRESETGSLVRVVHEYYTIFQHGMGDRRRALVDPHYARRNAADIAYKENFLRSVMVEDAVTGDMIGPDASLMQWHFFSAAHANLMVQIDRVEVTGDPSDPFVELHSSMKFVCGPQTLAFLFPGAEKNPDLLHKFENRRVTFPVVTRFKFDADDRICFENVNTNLVQGYLAAGVAMEDIAHVLRHVVVSASMTVREEVVIPAFEADAQSVFEEVATSSHCLAVVKSETAELEWDYRYQRDDNEEFTRQDEDERYNF